MKKNILVYDDDDEILLLCRIILEKYNYSVQTLSSCNDVVTDVKNLKPDFILMDLWIPQLGGEKAVKILKENAETKKVPIFLFSANSDVEEICLRTQADGFIAKPFDLKAFVKIIQDHIQ